MYNGMVSSKGKIYFHDLLLIYTAMIGVIYLKSNMDNSNNNINKAGQIGTSLLNGLKNGVNTLYNGALLSENDPYKNSKLSSYRQEEIKKTLEAFGKIFSNHAGNLEKNIKWSDFFNDFFGVIHSKIKNMENKNVNKKNDNLIACLKKIRAMYEDVSALISIWSIKDYNINNNKSSNVMDSAIINNLTVFQIKGGLFIITKHLNGYYDLKNQYFSSVNMLYQIGSGYDKRKDDIKIFTEKFEESIANISYCLACGQKENIAIKCMGAGYNNIRNKFKEEATGKWLFSHDGKQVENSYLENSEEINNKFIKNKFSIKINSKKNKESLPLYFQPIEAILRSSIKPPSVVRSGLLFVGCGLYDITIFSKKQKFISEIISNKCNNIYLKNNGNIENRKIYNNMASSISSLESDTSDKGFVITNNNSTVYKKSNMLSKRNENEERREENDKNTLTTSASNILIE